MRLGSKAAPAPAASAATVTRRRPTMAHLPSVRATSGRPRLPPAHLSRPVSFTSLQPLSRASSGGSRSDDDPVAVAAPVPPAGQLPSKYEPLPAIPKRLVRQRTYEVIEPVVLKPGTPPSVGPGDREVPHDSDEAVDADEEDLQSSTPGDEDNDGSEPGRARLDVRNDSVEEVEVAEAPDLPTDSLETLPGQGADCDRLSARVAMPSDGQEELRLVNQLIQHREVQETVTAYNRTATNYDEEFPVEVLGGPRFATEAVLDLFPEDGAVPRGQLKVLDVAAGTGLVGQRLYDAGIRNLDALEPSSEMIKIAQSRGIYQRIIETSATKHSGFKE
ncbi:Methyltransferase-like protein 27 [Amphibalanus amphitrite]|uniref:Methyltransferase-like protein 27 n=1 Tax=Amphibalanus amphitrite TaxID=1232801 RepID=A0A6A4WQ09_AMPAM|nr:Methyltransferase-like protein 27 [Amphibalanus amphitrite]